MRRLGIIIAIGLAAGLAGCITPSIPIPPPDPARMNFAVVGEPGNTTASFAYPPTDNYAGAIVFVFNRELGVGIIETANDDGSVGPTKPVRADLGHQMIVSFQQDDQTVSTCVRLQEGPQSATNYCDP